MQSDAAVLFDIDGTLLRKTGPAHRDALSVAVRQVFGVEATTDGIPVQGMLDQDILTAMLRRTTVQASQVSGAMADLQSAAEAYYLTVCSDLRHAACPGVRPLLNRLHDKGVKLALVTGNFTRIGWHKLHCAGLRQYFAFGAFAEMAPSRAELAALAARELGAAGRVYLVGDAPSDIEAAQQNGFVSIAVNTGISSRDELAALKPDYLLPSLRFWPREIR